MKFSARSRITTINRSLKSFLAAAISGDDKYAGACAASRVTREAHTMRRERTSEKPAVRTMLRHDATTARARRPTYYVSRTGSGKDKAACGH